MAQPSVINFLKYASQPWVRYNTLRFILNQPIDKNDCKQAYHETIKHPLVQSVIKKCLEWPNPPLKSHKAASHPMHHLCLLADLGIMLPYKPIVRIVNNIAGHQDSNGAFQSLIVLPSIWGGSNRPDWLWMFCDAPVLLHACLAFGKPSNDGSITAALDHLSSVVEQKKWTCFSSLEKLKGPGRKNDPCPYATLLALRAFSVAAKRNDSSLMRQGIEILLKHWESRKSTKLRMFGIGTDFKKLKYPFVFYDILHVVDVLSRFPWVWNDKRFLEMVHCIENKRNAEGLFTPESAWMAFKGFDFAQKKEPSPTLTFIIERILKRRYNENSN